MSLPSSPHVVPPHAVPPPVVPPLPRVAFQGELGAFSELAVRLHWPDGACVMPCRSFPDALAALLDRHADFAVIPVENAIIGPVHSARAALDAASAAVTVRDELRVPVQLCLLAQPGVALEELRTAHSHPAALAQCRAFLTQHDVITPVEHDDTAGAARDIATRVDRTCAAIASEVAADRYGLSILARGIQDLSENFTRFVVVSRHS